jgi:hypothetical protein
LAWSECQYTLSLCNSQEIKFAKQIIIISPIAICT